MINKNKAVFLFASCVASLFLASASFSSTLVLNLGSRNSSPGGEFNVYSTTLDPTTLGYASNAMANINSQGMGFETFCVEHNETFTPGSTYYYQISQGAINGGVSGGNPDPISLGTAWLYLNFAHGTLAGYSYTTDGAGNTSAMNLQNTIWWLEGEITPPPSNAFTTAVLSMFGNAAGAMANNNGVYGVGVLNLWADANHTQNAQDQLILLAVPDGGTTVALLGVSVFVLAFARSRCKREASH